MFMNSFLCLEFIDRRILDVKSREDVRINVRVETGGLSQSRAAAASNHQTKGYALKKHEIPIRKI
jgi:hypothetical protein